MKNFVLTSILFALTFVFLSPLSFAETKTPEEIEKLFPNRKFYPQLDYISTDELAKLIKADKVIVADARPEQAFKTLKIKNAIHTDITDKEFMTIVLEHVKQNPKDIVFYCGGLACRKSYKASDKTMQAFQNQGINLKVYTYDAGVSAFASSYPELALKNGAEISEDNPVYDTEEIVKHELTPEDFVNKVQTSEDGTYAILDVREPTQKILNKLFMFKKEKNISLLHPDKLTEFLNGINERNVDLYVYGSVQKQIETLYSLIQTAGVEKWYYLQGGEYGYTEYMTNKYGLKKAQ